MNIEYPANKRPSPTNDLDEDSSITSSPKRPRGQLAGRDIERQTHQISSLEQEGGDYDITAGNLPDRDVEAMDVSSLLPCAFPVSGPDIRLVSPHLFVFSAFLNGDIPTCLIQRAITPGCGQNIAITLVNYLKYMNDCSLGKRIPEKHFHEFYLMMIVNACKAFVNNEEISGLYLDAVYPGVQPLINPDTEFQGDPATLSRLRQEMAFFFSQLSGDQPVPVDPLPILAKITGLNARNMARVNVVRREHLLVGSDHVAYTRLIPENNFMPTFAIRVDGRPIRECFLQQQDEVLQQSPSYVLCSEAGLNSGIMPDDMTKYTETFFQATGAEGDSRFMVYLPADVNIDTSAVRGTVIATEDVFTLPFVGNECLTASTVGVLYLSPEEGGRMSLLRKTERGWERACDGENSSLLKGESLAHALSPTDIPVMLLCRIHKDAAPVQAQTSGQVAAQVQTAVQQVDKEVQAAVQQVDKEVQAAVQQVDKEVEAGVQEVEAGVQTVKVQRVNAGMETEQPVQINIQTQTERLVDAETQTEGQPQANAAIQAMELENMVQPPDPVSMDINPESPTDDIFSSGEGAAPEPDLAVHRDVPLPELSGLMRESLDFHRGKRHRLGNISPDNYNDELGEASPGRQLPQLPELRNDIHGWDYSVLSYIIHVYQYDQDNARGQAIHNPEWASHALRVLTPESPHYQDALTAFIVKEWESYKSAPTICQKLIMNGVTIPPMLSINPELHGTCQWSLSLVGQLLSKLNLVEAPLYPHPMVHEIVDLINRDCELGNYVKQLNRWFSEDRQTFPEGHELPRSESFKCTPSLWTKPLVRYFVEQHRAFIEAQLGRKVPSSWEYSSYDRLALLSLDHEEAIKALRLLIEKTVNDVQFRKDFLSRMNGRSIKIKPSELPWANIAEERWDLSTLNRLAAHFQMAEGIQETLPCKIFITQRFNDPKKATVSELASRLADRLQKDASYKPPQLEGMPSAPDKWTRAVVKVVTRQTLQEQGREVPREFEPEPGEILSLFRPDTTEYHQSLKLYLQNYIAASELLSFQGLLNSLNTPIKSPVKMNIETPVIPELTEEQQGVTPWTREILDRVISHYALENAPENKGCGLLEILEVFARKPKTVEVKAATSYLNKWEIPMPEDFISRLTLPTPEKWRNELTRLATALYTNVNQNSLPAIYRVTTKDITSWIRPECWPNLPESMRALLRPLH